MTDRWQEAVARRRARHGGGRRASVAAPADVGQAQAERGLAAAARRGSGGQQDRVGTAHLNAINRLPGPKPWKLSFSYGRALQDPALEAWHGRDENLKAGQEALYHRARCNGAASLGKYTEDMEAVAGDAGSPAQRRDRHDD